MNGLFISYRREDSAPYAGRLHDYLQQAFPEREVFIDIDAIEPGEDFVEAIQATLGASKVVITIIGPRWLSIADEAGKRRLDDPEDYVVRELSAALNSSARVIPVLVGGAAMPRTEMLPESLQALARRNAIEISDTRFAADAERLATAISKLVGPSRSHAVARRSFAGASDGARHFPELLTTFKTLVWTKYALGVFLLFADPNNFSLFSRFFEIAQSGKGDDSFDNFKVLLYFFSVVFTCLIDAWLNVMLLRGRNWARLTVLVTTALFTPALFRDWQEKSTFLSACNIASIALSLIVIYLMFSRPLNGMYRREVVF